MNTLYAANQDTVLYFDNVMCCRDFLDQNFDQIRCLIRLPCHTSCTENRIGRIRSGYTLI